MENVSAKLKEIFTEINTALDSLDEAVKRSPKEIIGISKIIEKGEKRIIKEYEKRMEEIKSLQAEIEAITEFANKMGYTLSETTPEETPEESTENAPEEQPTEQPQEHQSEGIKIVIGDNHHANNE